MPNARLESSAPHAFSLIFSTNKIVGLNVLIQLTTMEYRAHSVIRLVKIVMALPQSIIVYRAFQRQQLNIFRGKLVNYSAMISLALIQTGYVKLASHRANYVLNLTRLSASIVFREIFSTRTSNHANRSVMTDISEIPTIIFASYAQESVKHARQHQINAYLALMPTEILTCSPSNMNAIPPAPKKSPSRD